MDDFAALMEGLHGFSFALGLGLGLVGGFVFAMLTYRFYGRNFRATFDSLSDEMKTAFQGLSSEALASSQKELVSLADRELDKKTEQHATELESKKELIDTQLRQMKETLDVVPSELEKNQNNVSEVIGKSTEQLKESNQNYLDQLTDKAETQTKEHVAELQAKKKLIDQQLEQMSSVLKTVPTELEKNQKGVSEVIEKSAKSLEESNITHLTQLQTRSDTQTKEHIAKLDEKELLINRRLGEMDAKLGKVQELIDEFEKARESKLGALDDQLKNLTQTTSELHRALADNRARGQWGERMAEDMLNFMGLVEGVNYVKQSAIEAGARPDFTFLFPNQKSLNMDAKFPLDNYLRYVEADNDAERKEFSQKFLRDVNQRVLEIQKREYISAATLDCVLIFIPNEQVYRFICEEDQRIIDNALKQKVIMCSPLTLYIVLAVIRQAAQNFNIEQRSREIIDVVNDIRKEWDKYTGQMDKLERRFKGMYDDFHALTGARTRQLDRKFVQIDSVTKSNQTEPGDGASLPQLTGDAKTSPDELPF